MGIKLQLGIRKPAGKSPLFYLISDFIHSSLFICNFFCNGVPEEKLRKQQKCLHYVHTIEFQLSSFVSFKNVVSFSPPDAKFTLWFQTGSSRPAALFWINTSFGFTQQVFVRFQSGEFVAANQSPDVFNLHSSGRSWKTAASHSCHSVRR